MSDYIQKRMKKLKVDDDGIIAWANANGYSSLLPGNISMVRQIYIEAHDDEELEFPDLEMRGTRVAVRDIPSEQWVILRVFMFKIARTTTYNMCPEEGCYARVTDSECKARDEKSHGYVAEHIQGIRHYYSAGDGGVDGEQVYVIVPAKYAMNGYNFEKKWCDVKGIWNDTLEGFYANLILEVSEDELAKGGVEAPVLTSTSEVEEGETVASIPKELDMSAFSKKAEKEAPLEPVDEATAEFEAELKQFQQIIQFFKDYPVSAFDKFINGNNIKTPLEDLVNATPGCEIKDGKVLYNKPT